MRPFDGLKDKDDILANSRDKLRVIAALIEAAERYFDNHDPDSEGSVLVVAARQRVRDLIDDCDLMLEAWDAESAKAA